MAFYRGYCIFIARIFSPPYEGPDIIAFLTQFFRPYDKGGSGMDLTLALLMYPGIPIWTFSEFFLSKSRFLGT